MSVECGSLLQIVWLELVDQSKVVVSGYMIESSTFSHAQCYPFLTSNMPLHSSRITYFLYRHRTVCITIVIIRAMLLLGHICLSYSHLYCKTLDWMRHGQDRSVSTMTTAEVILYLSVRVHCVLVLGLSCTSIGVEDYLVLRVYLDQISEFSYSGLGLSVLVGLNSVCEFLLLPWLPPFTVHLCLMVFVLSVLYYITFLSFSF
jgi:hypothetical protein